VTRSAPPSVVAIVLNWCAEALTAACIRSLQASDYPALEILLVDNGSPDGSGERLHEAFPAVSFLQTGRNLGYTGGNNRGIEWALERGRDHVLILNNDTEVAPDAVSHLVAAASGSGRPGAVAPKILYYQATDRIWFAGGDLSKIRVLGFHRREGEPDRAGEPGAVERVSFLTGCCLLIPAEVVRDVGPLEESFFAYAEDVELSMRLKAAGYELLYQPRARVLHHVPPGRVQPAPWQIVLRDRNRRRTARLHLTRAERLRFGVFFFGSRMIHLARYLSKGDVERARATWEGMTRP
jgi:GT2 family glycosyltransferase